MKNLLKNWLFGSELERLKQLEEEKKHLEEEAAKPKLSEKEQATMDGLPYVDIIRVEYDPKNPGDGAFELDWNVYFISFLRQNGFVGDNDAAIVDQWFTQVCKNIGLETYEQMIADPEKRAMIEKRDLGGGKAEYS